MKKKEILVSVIVPTYNSEATIKETLDSIINQTHKNLEIIVSDNVSTDNTINIVKTIKDKRIRININNKNLFMHGNINQAIKLTKGEFICVFHSDDIYEKTIIEKELQFLIKNDNVMGVFTMSNIINQNGNLLLIKNLPFNTNETVIVGSKELFFPLMLKYGNFFVSSSAMLRKSVYTNISLWSQEYPLVEDQYLWLKILDKHNLAIINECLMNYRIYDVGSKNYKKYRTDISPEFALNDLYIKKNYVKLDEKTKKIYSQMKSKGYLFCAVNSLLIKDYEKMAYNLKKSKETYNYNFFSFYGIIQFILSLNFKYLIRILTIFLIFILKRLKLNKKFYVLNFI